MKYNILKFRFVVSTTALIILLTPSAIATLTETIEDDHTANQFYISPFNEYDDQSLLSSQSQEEKMKARFSSSKNHSPQSKRFSSLLSTIKEED